MESFQFNAAGNGKVTEVPPMAEPGLSRRLRRLGARLARTVGGGLRVVFPQPITTRPQGLRERRRRVKQIVMGIIPFTQLGGRDSLAEYHLAKRNYSPLGLGGR